MSFPILRSHPTRWFPESNTLGAACTGGIITQTVNIVAAPTATITTADILTPADCGAYAAQGINIAIVENVPDANAAYAFNVEEFIETIDGAGVQIAPISTTSNFVEFTIGAKAQVGVTAGMTGATPNFDYDFNSSVLTLQGGIRTRYTYTLREAAGAGVGSDGIISAISHKSDYIDGLSVNGFTDAVVVFIVNPTPITGPIYHIPNNFNY